MRRGSVSNYTSLCSLLSLVGVCQQWIKVRGERRLLLHCGIQPSSRLAGCVRRSLASTHEPLLLLLLRDESVMRDVSVCFCLLEGEGRRCGPTFAQPVRTVAFVSPSLELRSGMGCRGNGGRCWLGLGPLQRLMLLIRETNTDAALIPPVFPRQRRWEFNPDQPDHIAKYVTSLSG